MLRNRPRSWSTQLIASTKLDVFQREEMKLYKLESLETCIARNAYHISCLLLVLHVGLSTAPRQARVDCPPVRFHCT